MNINRILLATDLSENSLPAVRAAQELVKIHQGKYEAIHVVDLSLWKNRKMTDIWRDAELQKKVEEKVRRFLLLERLAQPDRVIVETGTPSRSISNVAGEEDHTLVVIAMSGRGAWNRLVFGSTALQLTNRAPEQVWIAHPEKWQIKKGMKIAVGTDFAPTSDAALREGAHYCRLLGSPLHIVFSTALPSETVIADDDLPEGIERTSVNAWAEKEMADLLERSEDILEGVEVKTQIYYEPPVWGLRRHVEEEEIGLLLLGHRRPEDRQGTSNVKAKWVQQMTCSTLLVRASE